MTNEEIRKAPEFRKKAGGVMASDGPFERRLNGTEKWDQLFIPEWSWSNSIYRRVYNPQLVKEWPFRFLDSEGTMYASRNRPKLATGERRWDILGAFKPVAENYHFHDWTGSLREYKPSINLCATCRCNNNCNTTTTECKEYVKRAEKKLVPWTIEDWLREMPEWVKNNDGEMVRLNCYALTRNATGVSLSAIMYGNMWYNGSSAQQLLARKDGTKFEKEVEA